MLKIELFIPKDGRATRSEQNLGYALKYLAEVQLENSRHIGFDLRSNGFAFEVYGVMQVSQGRWGSNIIDLVGVVWVRRQRQCPDNFAILKHFTLFLVFRK